MSVSGIILPGWKSNISSIDVCTVTNKEICTKRVRMKAYDYLENISELIYENSKRVNMDPLILLTIVANESAFNPNALGKRGEKGLCQIMPYGIASKSRVINKNGQNIEVRIGNAKLFIPSINLELCSDNLKECNNKCGNEPEDIAGCHNEGLCPVSRNTNYIRKFERLFYRFKILSY
jgi:hypothetical protein